MRGRLYLSPPHTGGEEMEYIRQAFEDNWIAPMGPHVEAFERECAEHAGRSAALALSSGTSAAALAARLLGIKPGDRFFCSSLTFAATPAPFAHAGAVPVFIDSEPQSWNISPRALSDAFDAARRSGAMPRAVVIANLYGQSCDMDAILPMCREYGVPVIEDAAESLGGMYKGRQTGAFGDFSFYSFNGNKIITASGGGMLLSDDGEAIARGRFLSSHARDDAPWYQHSELGYNFQMSNILAGIGRAQLKLLPGRVARRRGIFNRYKEALSEIPGVSFMPEPEWSVSNRWLSVITVDPGVTGANSMGIIEALAAENVEARPVWKPMHMQPVFAGTKYFRDGGRDVSAGLFENGLCLPSGSGMSPEDQEFVIAIVRRALIRDKRVRRLSN